MPCTPALFSLPVEQAQVQVIEGKVQASAAAAAAIPAAAAATAAQAPAAAAARFPKVNLFGQLWPKSIWDGETGFCNGLGTYQPTVKGYAADAPSAGGKSYGLGPPTEPSTTLSEGGMLQMPQAGSLRSGVPDFPSTYERGGLFYSKAIPPPHALW